MVFNIVKWPVQHLLQRQMCTTTNSALGSSSNSFQVNQTSAASDNGSHKHKFGNCEIWTCCLSKRPETEPSIHNEFRKMVDKCLLCTEQKYMLSGPIKIRHILICLPEQGICYEGYGHLKGG